VVDIKVSTMRLILVQAVVTAAVAPLVFAILTPASALCDCLCGSRRNKLWRG